MKSSGTGAAVSALVGAMETHKVMATRLLSDEGARGAFLDVIYELLKRGSAEGLFGAARDEQRPG